LLLQSLGIVCCFSWQLSTRTEQGGLIAEHGESFGTLKPSSSAGSPTYRAAAGLIYFTGVESVLLPRQWKRAYALDELPAQINSEILHGETQWDTVVERHTWSADYPQIQNRPPTSWPQDVPQGF
jgi:hypothetical protein